MRGPTPNTKAGEIEETDVSELQETKRGNITDDVHLSCNVSMSNTSTKKEEDDNNKPIWKVGRILIDSLSKGKMRRTKIFGAPLEDLPLNCQGIPKIVQRLCSYLEHFGLTEPDLFTPGKRQGKFVERYKISFDRAGDADLENCGDVKVIASLLKLWLLDLPHPLIPLRISNRLKIAFQKYNRKEVYDVSGELCNVLITCPALNLGVLYTVVRLLHYYVTKWCTESYVDQLPEMFAKILIGNVDVEHVEIISVLVHNFHIIFNEKILERAFKLYVIRDKKSGRTGNQKCADIDIAIECGSSALSVEKLSRSNSEEKLNLRSDHNQNLSTRNLNIRRVNSHEDFSGSQHNNCRAVQGHLANLQAEKPPKGNVCEYGDDANYDEQYDDEPVVDNFQKIAFDKDSEVLIAPPPFHYNEDYRVQEEIRNEERFAPQFSAHRSLGRKKRTIYQNANDKPNVVFEDDLKYVSPKSGEFFDGNVHDYVTCVDESSVFSAWNTAQDYDTHSTSSTSSSSSSECNSPIALSAPPEPAQYCHDRSEPFYYHRNWNYAHRHSHIVKKTNSNRPVRDDEAASSYIIHISNIDAKIFQVNKNLQWAKKKLRHLENNFKDRCDGDVYSDGNKMAHPEHKQLSRTIIFLKNDLKQLRKEANISLLAHRTLIAKNSNNSYNLELFSHPADKQKAAESAQKRLCEKRVASKRPECVENMTHEQLFEEKASIQEELLRFENFFGQTAVRNEELFKSVYSRYRTVKRYLARSSILLKLRDTVTDLATIMENETMEFDAGTTNTTSINERAASSSGCQSLCTLKTDIHTNNIHGLSSPELMMEYRRTKDEKKKLRNRIYVYEQEAENQVANDSKHCIHSLRSRYKNTKAKLRLLEALLMKTK